MPVLQPSIDACDECKIPGGMIWYAILAALLDLANGDEVPSNTQELLDEAQCLICNLTPGMVPYAILAAIRGISGGGGLGTQQVYIDRDPAAPDDPTKPALSFPSGGGTLTQWNVGTATWV